MANRKERREAARKKGNDDNGSEAVEPDAVLGGAGPAAPAMPFPDHEEDVLFKTQMRVLNLVLGHWKAGLAVIGAVLLVVLGVGQYQNAQVEAQRGFQAEIADIDRRMPVETAEERFGLNAEGILPEVKANVEEGARRYEAVAGGATDAAAVTAWLKAGAAWKRAGNSEKAGSAFAAAHAIGSGGVVGWSAASQYAASLAEAGNADQAIVTLEAVRPLISGLEAHQTDLTIAMLREESGDLAGAASAYKAFIESNPGSVLSEQASDGIARIEGAQ